MAHSSKTTNKMFSHLDQAYQDRWAYLGESGGRYNGAYYYSKEIVENIIPRVKTDRPWVTVNVPGHCFDHAIVFIHKNTHLEAYDWLRSYKDLVLVCSTPSTYNGMEPYGEHIVFLPLSVDVDYVKQFAVPEKTEDNAYCGNLWAFKIPDLKGYLPKDTDIFTNMPREELLKKIAPYKNVYAIGRCAIEAKILGCNVKVCDQRYRDPSFWKIVDNKDAAKMLQEELNLIEGR